MIGATSVSERAPATHGAAFIYGYVELPALEPAYVEHGRRRPKDGPLVEALDRFITEKVRLLAHEINARRRRELDDKALDEVHKENRKLDEFKNRFLPSFGEGGGGDGDGKGPGPRKPVREGPRPVNWGTEPEVLDYEIPNQDLNLGKDQGHAENRRSGYSASRVGCRSRSPYTPHPRHSSRRPGASRGRSNRRRRKTLHRSTSRLAS